MKAACSALKRLRRQLVLPLVIPSMKNVMRSRSQRSSDDLRTCLVCMHRAVRSLAGAALPGDCRLAVGGEAHFVVGRASLLCRRIRVTVQGSDFVALARGRGDIFDRFESNLLTGLVRRRLLRRGLLRRRHFQRPLQGELATLLVRLGSGQTPQGNAGGAADRCAATATDRRAQTGAQQAAMIAPVAVLF